VFATPTFAQQQQNVPGPPYIQAQLLGALPTSSGDAAACGLALFLFFIGVMAHVYLFVHNKRRGRFFPLAVGVASK
jgi:hypothetical protein